MDFVSHRMGPRAKLLNGVPNNNHWIQITLEPSSGNMDAIGSVVTAWKGGVGDMRMMTCGSEYLSQNSRRLHFGFGSSTSIDSVTVDWPSGNHTVEFSPTLTKSSTCLKTMGTAEHWQRVSAPTRWLATTVLMQTLTMARAILPAFVDLEPLGTKNLTMHGLLCF